MALTKARLYDVIKNRIGFSRKKSACLIEIPLETIKGGLESAEDMMISNFGNSSAKKKKQRKGGNPATG